MILGLDCSMSVCGWSMFDGGCILDAGFIDISKFETNKEKIFYILNFLTSRPHIAKLKEIKLEAALSGFMRGKTSQQIVIKLSRFNAILEYVLSEQLKVPVTLINVNTARKSVLGKAFIKGISPKDYVRQELPKKFPEIIKFEKENRKGEWNVKNGDMYDSIVISAC